MNFNVQQLNELKQRAIKAALAAGAIINAHRHSSFHIQQKNVGSSAASQIVTEVDHTAQAAILAILQPSCLSYDLALLAEESRDDGERHQKAAFWCIDPMDGTLAFVKQEAGFSVSIALVAQNGTPLIGVVFDPVTETLFSAVRGQGAYKNGCLMQRPKLDQAQPLVLTTDFSFQQHRWLQQTQTGLEAIADVLDLPGAEIHFRIGAVMNACHLLETPNHCYFKYPREGASGGSLWDYAATACLFHEVGAVAVDIEGQPLALNRLTTTFMNHRGLLYAGNESVAEQIMGLYQRFLACSGA
ncbi:MAG: inositol monophosphatase family protein [Gammaproteobacteria bacterium]|nr:inositol monophosphatase family protein [Gammaproteobacteria bacterium]